MTGIGCTPFVNLGMTPEKYVLLKELASTSDYWLLAYTQMEAAANLELILLNGYLRGRLASIILELDAELYRKSWGIDKIVFKATQKPKWQMSNPESSFSKMRRTLTKEKAV